MGLARARPRSLGGHSWRLKGMVQGTLLCGLRIHASERLAACKSGPFIDVLIAGRREEEPARFHCLLSVDDRRRSGAAQELLARIQRHLRRLFVNLRGAREGYF